jgi:hypothetical protein
MYVLAGNTDTVCIRLTVPPILLASTLIDPKFPRPWLWSLPFSGMWRLVSEECTACVFRAKYSVTQAVVLLIPQSLFPIFTGPYYGSSTRCRPHSPSYLWSVLKKKVAWRRDRTIQTDGPPLVGEVTANFWGKRVSRGQRDGSLQQYSRISRSESVLSLPSSSSIVLTSLSGPCSGLTTSQKIWQCRESNSDLWICSRDLRLQRRSTFFYITYINSVRTSQETIHLRSAARNSGRQTTEAVYLLHTIK